MTERTRLTVVGCGWFGLALARRGVELGWDVHGSARTAARVAELVAAGVSGFTLDLADPEFAANPFSHALVVVAVPPGRGDPARAAAYEAGVLRLVAHAHAQGARAVAVITSTSVYGGLTGEVDEDTEPTDTNRVLVRVERALRQAPLPTCAVRFGGLIGPDRHPGRFLAGRHDLPNGDHPVNLVTRPDCVAATELLLKVPAPAWPPRINAVAPEHPTRRDFYTQAAERLGLEPPTFATKPSGTGRTVRTRWLDARSFRFSPLA